MVSDARPLRLGADLWLNLNGQPLAGTRRIALLAEIARLVTENDVIQVVVGLPIRLNGAEGPAAIDIRAYADRLARALGRVPVVLADERMSTVVATRRLAERGVRGKRQRAVVDQAAAVEILQSWLDGQRRQTR